MLRGDFEAQWYLIGQVAGFEFDGVSLNIDFEGDGWFVDNVVHDADHGPVLHSDHHWVDLVNNDLYDLDGPGFTIENAYETNIELQTIQNVKGYGISIESDLRDLIKDVHISGVVASADGPGDGFVVETSNRFEWLYGNEIYETDGYPLRLKDPSSLANLLQAQTMVFADNAQNAIAFDFPVLNVSTIIQLSDKGAAYDFLGDMQIDSGMQTAGAGVEFRFAGGARLQVSSGMFSADGASFDAIDPAEPWDGIWQQTGAVVSVLNSSFDHGDSVFIHYESPPSHWGVKYNELGAVNGYGVSCDGGCDWDSTNTGLLIGDNVWTGPFGLGAFEY